MKLIIAGSRDLRPSEDEITSHLARLGVPEVTQVVCGMAKGVDTAGYNWAINYDLNVANFPADWDKHGKAAGPIRNKQMAEYADALLLIWDGESRGSANMKSEMKKLNKPIYEVILRKS